MRSASDLGRATLALLLLATAALPLGARADQPPVAAQFRMEERSAHAGTVTREWRLWRSSSEVTRQDLPDGEIQQWQRDGDVILHRRLYPAEHRGVEFQPADLSMIDGQRPWTDLSSVVPPDVLARLAAGKPVVRKGAELQSFSGELDGYRWKIVMRTDLQVPVSVERRNAQGRQRLTLIEAHALEDTPWPAPDAAAYDVMDFADLGDHEHDPFAQRVEALIGLSMHAH